MKYEEMIFEIKEPMERLLREMHESAAPGGTDTAMYAEYYASLAWIWDRIQEVNE